MRAVLADKINEFEDAKRVWKTHYKDRENAEQRLDDIIRDHTEKTQKLREAI